MAGNYDQLYDQSRKRFLTFDQEEMIAHFRLHSDSRNIWFHILGREACLDRESGHILCDGERVGFNAACTVYDILSRAGSKPVLSGRWVSIVDLGGVAATHHAERLMPELSDLDGQIPRLRELCRSWGGTEQKQGDVSFILPLFDFFPVWLQYWEGDDEFPPKFTCLWDANTLNFMFYETTWYARGYLLNRFTGREDRA